MTCATLPISKCFIRGNESIPFVPLEAVEDKIETSVQKKKLIEYQQKGKILFRYSE